MKSLRLGKISRKQAIVFLVIVLLLLGNGYLYRAYRQENQKEEKLNAEYAAASRQVGVIRGKYAPYGVTRPEDIIPRLQEELVRQQGELALAAESYFPQKVEEVDIADMIVRKKGAEITLETLEMSPPGEKTVGASKYQVYQAVISAGASSDQALTWFRDWLQGIEESSLADPQFKTLSTGDIRLSLDGASWKAEFTVTALAQ